MSTLAPMCRTLGLVLLVAGLASPSGAEPRAARVELDAKGSQAQVDLQKERTVRAKARWLLFRAATVSTAGLARSPEEALAHAARSAPDRAAVELP